MKAYVVVFNMWDRGLTHSQAVAATLDLAKAQEFIENQTKGQKWAGMSRTEGAGEKFRRITDFSETEWTEYCIRRVEWLG